VAVLAGRRAIQPDAEVPLPTLPPVVVPFGLYTVASPFLPGSGLDVHGITLVISGPVSVVIPAMMITRLLGEAARAGDTTRMRSASRRRHVGR
jgi:hypothetical protein